MLKKARLAIAVALAVGAVAALSTSASAYPYGPGPYGGYAPVPPQRPGNGIGVAGFVCGLVGLVLCWVPWLGALLGLVGIVLSGIGISQGKKNGASIGLAVAGLVCGILAVLAFVLLLAFVFSVASSISTY